jgi:hypothetical protein
MNLRRRRRVSGAVPQQAGNRRADQGGESGGEDDPPLLSSFPLKPGAAGAEPVGLQSGQFERVDNLGAYSIPSETGLLIPSVRSSFVSQGVQSDRGATLGLAPAEKREL